MNQHKNNWLFALLLTLPLVVFYIGYLYNHDPSLTPTGFVQYDNVSYVAYAKQYTEASQWHFFYSNPFNDSEHYTPIYFQPQTIFFALLLKLGIPVGWILIPFTFICSLVCFRLLIAIIDHLSPGSRHRAILVWLLAWGGGLLTLSGWIAQQLLGKEAITSVFYLDPGVGWWGLNLGRSLFFSCEAYYHALFLGVVFCLLKKKWVAAVVLCGLLSLSHPFTGIEILCIVTAWAVIEKLFIRPSVVPVWLIICLLLLLAFHLFFYLYYLDLFADHHSVSTQYALDWKLRFYNMVPAYCIVGFLAAWTVFKTGKKKWIGIPHNRLFLTWFFVAFILANHEIFTAPRQPVHFTRGYIWTSLFLCGIPALEYFLNKFSVTRLRKAILAILLITFLSDNLLWIGLNSSSKAKTVNALYTDEEHHQVYDNIQEGLQENSLLISRDENIPYLATAYTAVYSWYSHPFTTPFADKKRKALHAFMENKLIDSSWRDKNLIFVFRKNDSLEVNRAAELSAHKSLETASFIVVKLKPGEFTP